MKKSNNLILIVFIAVIISFNLNTTLSQDLKEPMKEFAVGIVENYNALVYFQDIRERDFDEYRNFYSLYLEEGKRFSINIIEDSENNCFYIEYEKRIISSDYEIHFNEKSLNDISPGVYVPCNDMNIISNNLYSSDSYYLGKFILGVSNSHLNNLKLDSKSAAELIYNKNKEMILEKKSKEVSSNSTTQVSSEKRDPLDWVNIILGVFISILLAAIIRIVLVKTKKFGKYSRFF